MGAKAWENFNLHDAGYAEPINRYRQVEAREIRLADVPEPADEPVLGSLDICFGSQPGWSPSREGETVDLEMIAPDGLPCVVAVCRVCGSGLIKPDPLGVTMVCGACGRCCKDERIKALLAMYPAPGPG